jgi:hypothetical protein
VAAAREAPEDALYSPVLGPSGAAAAQAVREGLPAQMKLSSSSVLLIQIYSSVAYWWLYPSSAHREIIELKRSIDLIWSW